MDAAELLRPIFTEGDRLARSRADEILRHGEAVAPELARILRDEALWEAPPPAAWAVVHAAYLLAALRPPGSLEVLAEAVELALDFDEEFVSEPAPFFFAAYGPGAVDALRELSGDPGRSAGLRGRVNEALALVARLHPEARALDALRAAVDDAEAEPDVRAFAALLLLDFAQEGDRARIEAAADEDVLSAQEIEKAYREGPPELPPPHDWMSFYDPEEIAARQEGDEGDPDEAPEDAPPPPLRAVPTPGRNDPCPCGSRMKFKKCCGK